VRGPRLTRDPPWKGPGPPRPAQRTEVALTRLTITPQYSLSAMPAVNIEVTNFEFPENPVRVLLTGYGVSLAVTESTPYFVALSFSLSPYR